MQRTHAGTRQPPPLDNHTSILLVKKEEVIEFQPLSRVLPRRRPLMVPGRQRIAGVVFASTVLATSLGAKPDILKLPPTTKMTWAVSL